MDVFKAIKDNGDYLFPYVLENDVAYWWKRGSLWFDTRGCTSNGTISQCGLEYLIFPRSETQGENIHETSKTKIMLPINVSAIFVKMKYI